MTQTIVTGFIGLGSQGGPMAERMLAAGFPLNLWARRREAAEPLLAQGAQFATLDEMAARCDHIGICVTDDDGVAGLADSLVPAMRPGSLLVIHSTIRPETCERLAQACAARGIGFLDAPVSGGGPAAAAGTLIVMCGGEDAALAQARPVLESFAGQIFHVGAAGAAQRAKIVNNALMAANMGVAHAALGAAAGLGIDAAAFAALVAASSGRSFGFDICARLPSPAAFAHGAALLDKDVKLLAAILPDSGETQTLHQASAGFLAQALGQSAAG